MLPLLYSLFIRGNLVNVNLAEESIFSFRCVCMAQISNFFVLCLFSFLLSANTRKRASASREDIYMQKDQHGK